VLKLHDQQSNSVREQRRHHCPIVAKPRDNRAANAWIEDQDSHVDGAKRVVGTAGHVYA